VNDDPSGKVVPFRRERAPEAAREPAPATASAPQRPIPETLLALITAAKRLAAAADADLLTYLLDCCDLEARTLQGLAPPPQSALRLDDPA
jgi:hypothetical protein